MAGKHLLLMILVYFFSVTVKAEDSISRKPDSYKIKYFIDVPLTVTGLVASKYGTDYLRDRRPNNNEKISELTPGDVWWLDRGATRQVPSDAPKYETISTKLMRGAMFAPAILLADPKVRNIWQDYSLLYFEAQSVNAMAYLAGAIPVRRLRPFMYNQDERFERKTGRNTTNSFFSGHASVVATSTFFMVKVYYGLHPEAKNRVLFYSLAAIPPAATGYCRYKAAKHFPTDILTGIAVGALTGILVPELHKEREIPVSFFPSVSDQFFGFTAEIRL